MRRAEEPVAGAVKVSDHEEGEEKKPHTSMDFMIARGKERKKNGTPRECFDVHGGFRSLSGAGKM